MDSTCGLCLWICIYGYVFMDMCIGLCVWIRMDVFLAMGLWICMDVFLAICMDLYECVSGYVFGFV